MGGLGVNLWVAGIIVGVAVSVAVMVMSLVRRGAPVGGYFADSNRAAGVFCVLGTSFAVVLAFVIFLGFESYGKARNEAGNPLRMTIGSRSTLLARRRAAAACPKPVRLFRRLSGSSWLSARSCPWPTCGCLPILVSASSSRR